MKDRGQVSLEYMTMLGLSLIIFAAVLYTATFLMSTSNMQIDVDTAYRAVQGVRESADFIYVHGYPSKIPLGMNLPSGVDSVSIGGKVAKVRLAVGRSYTDVYAVTKANMTAHNLGSTLCDVNGCYEGYYILNFEALNPDVTGYDVNITVSEG